MLGKCSTSELLSPALKLVSYALTYLKFLLPMKVIFHERAMYGYFKTFLLKHRAYEKQTYTAFMALSLWRSQSNFY
jgi:hypothetical protein